MGGFSKFRRWFHNVDAACFEHAKAKSCVKHMLKLDSHGKLVRRVAERLAQLAKDAKYADDIKLISLMNAISHMVKKHGKKEYARIKRACENFDKVMGMGFQQKIYDV